METERERLRRELEEAMKRFLEAGGTITVVPEGFTMDGFLNKHMTEVLPDARPANRASFAYDPATPYRTET